MSTKVPGPSLVDIQRAAKEIETATIQTPVLALQSARWEGLLPPKAEVTVKMELFQQAGSFKARGVYLGMCRLTDEQRKSGVVAASGGNHALAVSWAAKAAGVNALIAMPAATDPVRVEGCKAMGADIVLTDTIGDAFEVMNREAAENGRVLMHPYDAEHMTLGAGVIGAEFAEQAPQAEVFVIPVGGGGLISGMASAIKQLRPGTEIIGVEPTGADSLSQSLAEGAAVRLERVNTIADSLGAPYALPYSFGVAAAYVDDMVQLEDSALIEGMRVYQDVLRVTAEPACAASLAAIMGPLKDRLSGRRVGIIACGSNIGLARFQELTA